MPAGTGVDPDGATLPDPWGPRQWIDLDPSVGEAGFAGALAEAGWTTAFFGKAHFATYHTFAPTGTPECLRSSAAYPPDWNGPYMGFQHVEMMLVGHNWFPVEQPPAGQHYERFWHRDGRGAERTRLYWEGEKTADQTWHSRLPVAEHNTSWTADRFLSWLPGAKGPWMAWVSFPDPHHPFDCPEPWSRLHDPAEVDLPEHRRRVFEGRPWWHEAVLTSEPQGEGAEVRKSYSRMAEQSDASLREIIANTYGQLALIDHNVGRILIGLEAAGLLDETLIVYASDHGDWLGDHGLVLKGPMHYEGLLRVPLLMRGPGVPVAVSDQPVGTLDLGPTFLDVAGAAPGLAQHGTSLSDVVAGGTRGAALNEWELLPARTGVGLSLQTVRTRTAKLTVDRTSGAGEMYDLAADPAELTNLFDAPEAAGLRAELERLLAARPDDRAPLREAVGMA